MEQVNFLNPDFSKIKIFKIRLDAEMQSEMVASFISCTLSLQKWPQI